MANSTYRQGDLDGLCGMYALVNGISFLLQLKPPPGFSEDLFEVVAKAVPRSAYPQVLWDGLNVDQMARLAKRAAAHLKSEVDFDIEVELPFQRRRFRSRDQFFDELGEKLQARYSIMILFIEWSKAAGGHAHWSVLREITPEKVRLVDSGGMKHLPVSRLGIAGDRGTRIYPPNTLMLTLSGIGGEKVS